MAPPAPSYDELAALVVDMRAVIADQAAQLTELRAENRALRERMTALEAQVGQHSGNSSKPPSQDPPSAPPRAPRGKGKRRAGGQPGREGRTWQPFTAGEVKETLDHVPDRCGHCLAPFTPGPLHPRSRPTVFQVAEVPTFALDVTEHRCHARACGECGKKTRAGLPAGVGPSPLGPRLQAAIALMAHRYRLSRRLIPDLLGELLGRRLSPGTVQAVIERASAACEAPVEEARAVVAASPVVNADETGWRHQGEAPKKRRHWVWVATGGKAAIFHVAPDRGASGLAGVLPADYSGIVTADRWAVYASAYGERRQLCWAHLHREVRAFADRGAILTRGPDAQLRARGTALAAWGKEADAAICAMFRLWHKFKDGRIDRQSLRRRMQRHESRLSGLLARGPSAGDKKLATFCAELSRQWREMWRFVDEPGCEPTNNAAERALRSLVILRRITLGTKSAAGKTALSRLMTVVETCRQQGKSPLTFLADAIRNKLLGHPAPRLCHVN